MKIKLEDQQFEIKYKDESQAGEATFIFKNDQRVFLKLVDAYLATNRTDSDVVNDGMANTLIQIKGIEDQDGNAVGPKQLFYLPREILANIRQQYIAHILKLAKADEEEQEKNASESS